MNQYQQSELELKQMWIINPRATLELTSENMFKEGQDVILKDPPSNKKATELMCGSNTNRSIKVNSSSANKVDKE